MERCLKACIVIVMDLKRVLIMDAAELEARFKTGLKPSISFGEAF